MKNSFLTIFIGLLLWGCTKGETEIPPDVLSRDEMVTVLIDVHLLEAKVNKLYLNPDSSAQVYNHYQKLLFEDLGITAEEYNRSLAFYIDELGEMRNIYNRVTDSLLARQKSQEIN